MLKWKSGGYIHTIEDSPKLQPSEQVKDVNPPNYHHQSTGSPSTPVMADDMYPKTSNHICPDNLERVRHRDTIDYNHMRQSRADVRLRKRDRSVPDIGRGEDWISKERLDSVNPPKSGILRKFKKIFKRSNSKGRSSKSAPSSPASSHGSLRNLHRNLTAADIQYEAEPPSSGSTPTKAPKSRLERRIEAKREDRQIRERRAATQNRTDPLSSTLEERGRRHIRSGAKVEERRHSLWRENSSTADISISFGDKNVGMSECDGEQMNNMTSPIVTPVSRKRHGWTEQKRKNAANPTFGANYHKSTQSDTCILTNRYELDAKDGMEFQDDDDSENILSTFTQGRPEKTNSLQSKQHLLLSPVFGDNSPLMSNEYLHDWLGKVKQIDPHVLKSVRKSLKKRAPLDQNEAGSSEIQPEKKSDVKLSWTRSKDGGIFVSPKTKLKNADFLISQTSMQVGVQDGSNVDQPETTNNNNGQNAAFIVQEEVDFWGKEDLQKRPSHEPIEKGMMHPLRSVHTNPDTRPMIYCHSPKSKSDCNSEIRDSSKVRRLVCNLEEKLTTTPDAPSLVPHPSSKPIQESPITKPLVYGESAYNGFPSDIPLPLDPDDSDEPVCFDEARLYTREKPFPHSSNYGSNETNDDLSFASPIASNESARYSISQHGHSESPHSKGFDPILSPAVKHAGAKHSTLATSPNSRSNSNTIDQTPIDDVFGGKISGMAKCVTSANINSDCELNESDDDMSPFNYSKNDNDSKYHYEAKSAQHTFESSLHVVLSRNEQSGQESTHLQDAKWTCNNNPHLSGRNTDNVKSHLHFPSSGVSSTSLQNEVNELKPLSTFKRNSYSIKEEIDRCRSTQRYSSDPVQQSPLQGKDVEKEDSSQMSDRLETYNANTDNHGDERDSGKSAICTQGQRVRFCSTLCQEIVCSDSADEASSLEIDYIKSTINARDTASIAELTPLGYKDEQITMETVSRSNGKEHRATHSSSSTVSQAAIIESIADISPQERTRIAQTNVNTVGITPSTKLPMTKEDLKVISPSPPQEGYVTNVQETSNLPPRLLKQEAHTNRANNIPSSKMYGRDSQPSLNKRISVDDNICSRDQAVGQLMSNDGPAFNTTHGVKRELHQTNSYAGSAKSHIMKSDNLDTISIAYASPSSTDKALRGASLSPTDISSWRENHSTGNSISASDVFCDNTPLSFNSQYIEPHQSNSELYPSKPANSENSRTFDGRSTIKYNEGKQNRFYQTQDSTPDDTWDSNDNEADDQTGKVNDKPLYPSKQPRWTMEKTEDIETTNMTYGVDNVEFYSRVRKATQMTGKTNSVQSAEPSNTPGSISILSSPAGISCHVEQLQEGGKESQETPSPEQDKLLPWWSEDGNRGRPKLWDSTDVTGLDNHLCVSEIGTGNGSPPISMSHSNAGSIQTHDHADRTGGRNESVSTSDNDDDNYSQDEDSDLVDHRGRRNIANLRVIRDHRRKQACDDGRYAISPSSEHQVLQSHSVFPDDFHNNENIKKEMSLQRKPKTLRNNTKGQHPRSDEDLAYLSSSSNLEFDMSRDGSGDKLESCDGTKAGGWEGSISRSNFGSHSRSDEVEHAFRRADNHNLANTHKEGKSINPRYQYQRNPAKSLKTNQYLKRNRNKTLADNGLDSSFSDTNIRRSNSSHETGRSRRFPPAAYPYREYGKQIDTSSESWLYRQENQDKEIEELKKFDEKEFIRRQNATIHENKDTSKAESKSKSSQWIFYATMLFFQFIIHWLYSK